MTLARTAQLGRRPVARRSWLAALAVLVVVGGIGATPWEPTHEGLQPIPPLRARVTDLTGTLTTSDIAAIETKLADWETRTTNQLAVLIVPTVKPESIEQYSIRVAEAWKIGQKGKDNGAILLIAKEDRQIRIEVGYGFEGVLTDLTSRRIIAESIAPLFKKGEFAAGINAGIDRIISVIGEGKPLAKVEPRRRASLPHFDLGTWALILLVAVPAIGSILRSILGNVGGSLVGSGIVGGAAWLFAGSLLIAVIAAIVALVVISFSNFGRGGRGLWAPGGGWSGGGFGGGGFGGGGGFSGGGGSFGGGGASGSW